jgi:hypothetical protein
MLHDRLNDPGAAASFTGTVLPVDEVAARLVRLADEPRPVVAMPRWRGAQVRLLDAFPQLSLSMAKLMVAAGQAGQRRQARRVGRYA